MQRTFLKWISGWAILWTGKSGWHLSQAAKGKKSDRSSFPGMTNALGFVVKVISGKYWDGQDCQGVRFILPGLYCLVRRHDVPMTLSWVDQGESSTAN
jgi:hypothetical protein